MFIKVYTGSRYIGSAGYFVGKPSVLGDIFGNRDTKSSVVKYSSDIRKLIREGDVDVCKEFSRMLALVEEAGDITLVCGCSYENCHSEAIKKILCEMIAEEERNVSKNRKLRV